MHARRLWLIVGWALILLVIYLSVAPVAIHTNVEQGDKFMHALTYASLMGWFSNLYIMPSRRRSLAAAFVAMGIALEFVQGWTGYRTFDVADMLANTVGVAVGWTLAPPRLPNILHVVEDLLRR